MVIVCLLAGLAQEAKPKFGYLSREMERLDWVGVSGSLEAPDETLEANSAGRLGPSFKCCLSFSTCVSSSKSD
jgi:hypothetical protein